MMAEADGNTTNSLNMINLTRARAGLTALTAANVSSVDQFELALATERRLEFAFENQRWFDMLRFNTTMTTQPVVPLIKAHFANIYSTHYLLYPVPRLTLAEMQAFVTTDRLLLPIPQREIDNNTRLVIPQNPGY